jgi:hypothetical protein
MEKSKTFSSQLTEEGLQEIVEAIKHEKLSGSTTTSYGIMIVV